MPSRKESPGATSRSTSDLCRINFKPISKWKIHSLLKSTSTKDSFQTTRDLSPTAQLATAAWATAASCSSSESFSV